MDAYRCELVLGWPCSANTYWRRNGSRYFIAEKGIAYRQSVRLAVLTQPKPFKPFLGGVAVDVKAYPPDHKRRDLDNLLKNLMDSLTYSGVYLDDFQVGKLSIERMTVEKPGRLTVTISSL